MTVEAGGTQAAYIGIQELSSTGTPLATHADLEAMTASVYATFQGLLLDSLVPLDTWNAHLDGTLTLDGLTLGSDRHPTNAGSLDFTLAFYAPKDPKAGTPVALETWTARQTQPLTARGRNATSTTPVRLTSGDTVYDGYDGAMNVIVDTDARSWEVSALLWPLSGSVPPVTEALVTLDPSDVGVLATATAQGVWSGKPEQSKAILMTVQPLTKDGKAVEAARLCTLTPTATSAVAGSQKVRWHGECLRDTDTRNNLRRVAMTQDASGQVSLTAEFLGLEYQAVTQAKFLIPTEAGLGVNGLTGAAKVAETSFSLDWSFSADADGGEYGLEVYLYGSNASQWQGDAGLTLDLVGDGMYDWDFADPVWEDGQDETGVYAKATTDGAGTRSTTTTVKSGRPELK